MTTRNVQTDYAGVHYLHSAGDLLHAAKLRSYALMQVAEGQRVLDVGCGPGIDTVALAQLVGADGEVVGVDMDTAMLRAADERAATAGVGAWVTHRAADAAALPFPDDRFDASRSERLLQHLPQPEKVLAELVRITKPGGWVVVVDTDWGLSLTNTPHVDFEQRLLRFAAEHKLTNPYSGRRLFALFRQAGLVDVAAEPYLYGTDNLELALHIQNWQGFARAAVQGGAVTEEEAGRYFGGLEEAAHAGTFFAMLGGVIAAGRKAASPTP